MKSYHTHDFKLGFRPSIFVGRLCLPHNPSIKFTVSLVITLIYIPLFIQDRAPNFNSLIGAQIRYAREILQWCRVNQLDVPMFKAKNCVFIRDLQCGHYQHYFVSKLPCVISGSNLFSWIAHTTWCFMARSQ